MNRFFLESIGLVMMVFLENATGLPSKAMPATEPIWYNCLTREVFTPEQQIWCDRWQTLQNSEQFRGAWLF